MPTTATSMPGTRRHGSKYVRVDPSNFSPPGPRERSREPVTCSIVTPSYNQADFLVDTLKSVRRQTLPSVEHVVVDGESDDGTLDILREYDDDIRWVSEPDEGQSDAINKGFDMATGEYVGWLNSDDVYFDTIVLERVVDYFEQTGADVIYGDMALLDADSNVLKLHCVPDWDYDRLLRSCFVEQPALFFRREVLEGNRLDVDLAYVMDYEFWLRLGREYEFHHVSDVLAGDRNHPDRKILDQREAMQAEAAEIAREYGAPAGREYRLGRAVDAVASGGPRRLAAIARTIELHRSPPTLAFDGELCPLGTMLANVFRPNRTLVG